MINGKTSWSMFKIQISTQTDNHNLRKHVATNKKYILRKMASKFQNANFNIYTK